MTIGVSWKAPSNLGRSPITGYTASATAGAVTKTCHGGAAALSCSVLGLTNGTTYTVNVYSTNVWGNSPTTASLIKATPSTTQNCKYFGPWANLQNCQLTARNLRNADLTFANLAGAVLANADLVNANLDNTNLTKAVLANADLGLATLFNAILTNANLTSASLAIANLTNAGLTNANLTNANLAQAKLGNAKLTGAILTGITSGGTTGIHVVLPTNWRLVKGYLIGPAANLSGVDLSNTNLTNADMSNAILTGANLTSAILNNVNLSGALLNGANLTDATLGNADLTGAQLVGTNLTGAKFTGANLTGVLWLSTICPDGSIATVPQTCIGHGI